MGWESLMDSMNLRKNAMMFHSYEDTYLTWLPTVLKKEGKEEMPEHWTEEMFTG